MDKRVKSASEEKGIKNKNRKEVEKRRKERV